MTLKLSLRIFLPFALGYFLSYLYRVVNAVISADLVTDLHIGAAGLGLLTSAYFLTFAAFQLPLGIILDRYGPRRIEAALLLLAALGALVFAAAQSLSTLIIGRALIGLGVSACLMAAFKAYVDWFPKARLPLINNLQMAAGGMGALVGTAPVELALGFTSWRSLFVLLAGLTVLTSLAVLRVVPARPASSASLSFRTLLGGIKEIFCSWRFWKIAPVTIMTQATFLSIQSLWVGPWLRDVAGLDRVSAANVLLLMAVSIICGYVCIGLLTDTLNRYGIRPRTVALTGMALFHLVLLLILLEVRAPVTALWMLFGFLATSSVVPYAVLSQKFPPQLAGRVNTCLNLPVFLAAFAAQWGMGILINLWPSEIAGHYQIYGYRLAFGIMLVLESLGLLWWLMVHIVQRKQSD